MKNALVSQPYFRRSFKNKYLCLFLDFDGTLTPIRKKPGAVKLSSSMHKTLKALSHLHDTSVAIVSGRKLSDVQERIALPSITYVGNHGFEIQFRNKKIVQTDAKTARPLMALLYKRLSQHLKRFRGVIVENKEYTLSIHYRLLNPNRLDELCALFTSLTQPFVHSKDIKVTKGKKVWEIRPPITWHKGKSVSWLLKEMKKNIHKSICPVYIGDDTTDEDAFAAIKKSGIGIKVDPTGKSASHALYYVRNIAEVRSLLQSFKNIKYSHLGA